MGGSHNKRQEWGSNCERKGLKKSLLGAWEGFWYWESRWKGAENRNWMKELERKIWGKTEGREGLEQWQTRSWRIAFSAGGTGRSETEAVKETLETRRVSGEKEKMVTDGLLLDKLMTVMELKIHSNYENIANQILQIRNHKNIVK